MTRRLSKVERIGYVLAIASMVLLPALFMLGCVRPEYDMRMGAAAQLAAEAFDASVNDLAKDNAALRDMKIDAAFALVQAKAERAQPVTAAALKAWQDAWTANVDEFLALLAQTEARQRAVATQPALATQPSTIAADAQTRAALKANAAERERLLQEGEAMAARAAAADPVTATDLQKLQAGVKIDQAERAVIAEIVRKARAASDAVRILGQRSQAVGQQEQRLLQSIGIQTGGAQ